MTKLDDYYMTNKQIKEKINNWKAFGIMRHKINGGLWKVIDCRAHSYRLKSCHARKYMDVEINKLLQFFEFTSPTAKVLYGP